MSTDNPYQSPATASHNRIGLPPLIVWRSIVSGALLFVGVCFLLQMNGQTFTNALIFLALCGISLLIWTSLLVAPNHQLDRRRLAFYVILGHVALIVAIAPNLPGQYRFQQKFNAAMESSRQPANPKAIDNETRYR